MAQTKAVGNVRNSRELTLAGLKLIILGTTAKSLIEKTKINPTPQLKQTK